MNNANVPYQRGYSYGIGVDSASGDAMQNGVTGEPTKIRDAPGGSGSFQLYKVESMASMEEHLGISVKASGGVGLFSASARFNFARDVKVQTNSITLMLTCTREFGFTQIDKPVLDADAAKLVERGKLDLFMQRYGDCFVRGIASGGQFFGILQIETKSESERKSIEASLEGSYGAFSADVQTKLSTALSTTKSSATVSLYYEGGDVQKKPQLPNELFSAADEWSKSVMTLPKPYSVLLVPWVIANGPQPPNPADLQNQKDVLIQCADLRSQVIDSMNLLEYMLDSKHQTEFEMQTSDVNNLRSLYAGVSTDHDIIMKAASFALDNAKEAVEPITYARTKVGKPDYMLTVLAGLPKRVKGIVFPELQPFVGVWAPNAGSACPIERLDICLKDSQNVQVIGRFKGPFYDDAGTRQIGEFPAGTFDVTEGTLSEDKQTLSASLKPMKTGPGSERILPAAWEYYLQLQLGNQERELLVKSARGAVTDIVWGRVPESKFVFVRV